MRKVIAGVFLSLDGVMQGPGGPEEDPTGGFKHGGWVTGFFDEGANEAVADLFGRPYDLLLGRRTYEIFAAHWPFAEDGPNAEIARQFNACRKYVATRGGTPLSWANSIALADAASDVSRLKGEEGPDLIIQGSSNMVQALLAAGLIDEFVLMFFPVVLGRGKRFFGEGTRPGALKLTQSTSSPSGVTINHYIPAGAIPEGSFQHAIPTEAEVARREKMRREA